MCGTSPRSAASPAVRAATPARAGRAKASQQGRISAYRRQYQTICKVLLPPSMPNTDFCMVFPHAWMRFSGEAVRVATGARTLRLRTGMRTGTRWMGHPRATPAQLRRPAGAARTRDPACGASASTAGVPGSGGAPAPKLIKIIWWQTDRFARMGGGGFTAGASVPPGAAPGPGAMSHGQARTCRGLCLQRRRHAATEPVFGSMPKWGG